MGLFAWAINHLLGGKTRRCSRRHAILPVQCGYSLSSNTAGGSSAECPLALVLPALCPVRISASSSLLMAMMKQKSSSRKNPLFVSQTLTADNAQNSSGDGRAQERLLDRRANGADALNRDRYSDEGQGDQRRKNGEHNDLVVGQGSSWPPGENALLRVADYRR